MAPGCFQRVVIKVKRRMLFTNQQCLANSYVCLFPLDVYSLVAQIRSLPVSWHCLSWQGSDATELRLLLHL